MDPREYQLLMRRVLERVGFFEIMPARKGLHTETAPEPPNKDPELGPDNPRLAELRDQYRAYKSDARAHSQWSESFAENIDFGAFRGDSNYLWQYRDANVPLTYVATYYHHLVSGRKDLLERCTEDSAFGTSGIWLHEALITRDRLDSVAELGFLRDIFKLNETSAPRILDIGSGYGRFAWRTSQCFPDAQVLGVDAVPESAFLCEYYLRYRGASPNIRMVPLPRLEAELREAPVDFAVAFNSLSECSAVAIRWWLRLLAEHQIPNLVVAPHSGFDGGRKLFSVELPGVERVELTSLFAEYGYERTVLREKYTEPAMQSYGVSPTWFHVFSRKSS